MNLDEAVKKLKIEKLKPKQIRIITKLYQKRKNIIGVLPTGYGKSACYLVPHLLFGKNTIVISPLISLMEDQINKLDNYGIKYICFSSLHRNTQSNLKKVQDGSINAVLYFSPESFLNRQIVIQNLISKNSVGLICIDESHCLTTWKHFRQSYSGLSIIQKWIKGKSIPMLCLTATATNDMITNMMKNIKLTKATIVKGTFYKKNHYLNIYMKTNLDNDINKIIQLIRNNKGKTLIYCKTRNETEKLSKKLNLKRINSRYYHAQIRGSERLNIQKQYAGPDLNIMTSTIAFGMGVDIPNIHLIVHYGISHDIESYYQEIGRGGRDGKTTVCVVFWNNRDFVINKAFDNQISDLGERARSHQKIWKIREYVESINCRQQFICNYFNETIDICGKCDNCQITKNNKNIHIFTNYLILNMINDDKFSLTRLINNLFNSTTLTKSGKKDIREKVEFLINRNYLVINNKSKSREVELSSLGKKWYNEKKNEIRKALDIISKFITLNTDNSEISQILKKFNYY